MVSIFFSYPVSKLHIDFPVYNNKGKPIFDKVGNFIPGSMDKGSKLCFIQDIDKDKAMEHYAISVVDGFKV